MRHWHQMGGVRIEENILIDKTIHKALNSQSAVLKRYVANLGKSWPVLIVCGGIVPLILSVIWLLMIRHFVAAMTWITVIVFNVLIVSVAMFYYAKAGWIGNDAISVVIGESDPYFSTTGRGLNHPRAVAILMTFLMIIDVLSMDLFINGLAHIGGAIVHQELEEWELLYHSAINGLGFNTFMANISIGDGPTLLVIKDTDGYICGGYASQAWVEQGDFYGDMKSFLFQLYPHASIFRPAGVNNNLQWGGDLSAIDDHRSKVSLSSLMWIDEKSNEFSTHIKKLANHGDVSFDLRTDRDLEGGSIDAVLAANRLQRPLTCQLISRSPCRWLPAEATVAASSSCSINRAESDCEIC